MDQDFRRKYKKMRGDIARAKLRRTGSRKRLSPHEPNLVRGGQAAVLL
jgi:hypothetical protein